MSGTDALSRATAGYWRTVPHARINSSARQIRNRPRVSSHDLYQSMSVLRCDGFEEDVLQGHRDDVHRRRAERAGFVENRICAGAREQGEHAPGAMHALDARRVKRRRRRLAIEHELDSTEVLPQIVEGAAEHRSTAVERC